jgi:glycosyltransferase involved in cell wall biosynthesis
MPMHNAERFVAAALASVLLERDVPLEVIVINDRSTDGSLDAVSGIRDDRVRVGDGPGAGISACLNVGLKAARGDIVMRCDADDLYPPGRIQRQVQWLDANPEFAAVCGSFVPIDARGRATVRLDTGEVMEEITAELKAGTTRTHLCSYAIRAQAIAGMGGFRTYFVSGEDIDFQLRLAERARVMYLPELCYLYRLHDDSVTHTQGAVKRMFYENAAREFAAQRKTSGEDDLQRGIPPPPPSAPSDDPLTAARQIAGFLSGEAWREHAMGRRLKAIGLGWRAVAQAPGDPGSWKSLLALLLKPARGERPDADRRQRDLRERKKASHIQK